MATRIGGILYPYCDEIQRLRRQYQLFGDKADRFETQVTRKFKEHLIRQYSMLALEYLDRTYDTRAERAKVLRLDPTLLSRYKTRQQLPLKHLHPFSVRFQVELGYPAREEMSHRAAADTITSLRTELLGDRRAATALTREQYEFVLEALLYPPWDVAQRGGGREELERAFEQVYANVRKANWVTPCYVSTHWCLGHLMEIWRDAFLLGVDVIPYIEEPTTGLPLTYGKDTSAMAPGRVGRPGRPGLGW